MTIAASDTSPDSALELIRVAPLYPVAPLLRSMGYEPTPVFNAAGLDPADFLDIDHRIPYLKGARLLERCVTVTGNDQFGLLVGQRFSVAQMGLPGHLAGTALNVAGALKDITNYLGLHDQGGVATLHRSARYTAFGYAISTPDIPAADQIQDLCIAAICRILRSFCGAHWHPIRVELCRSAPCDPQPYKAFFRAPLSFDSPTSCVVFSNKWLAQSLPTADSPSHSRFGADALNLREAMPNSMSANVRRTLYSQFNSGPCNAGAVAELLGYHERTLHRRLQREGSSFRQLLDETRKVSSNNYLKYTNLPISKIASALGYGSTDAYDHAFKRWYGRSPRQWRASERGTANDPALCGQKALRQGSDQRGANGGT
ncbi:MAG: AraC family transcriptional regulator [Halioglobus sp.]|nr:AraC family transcriptional regulator [Halioglobus sp.]